MSDSKKRTWYPAETDQNAFNYKDEHRDTTLLHVHLKFFVVDGKVEHKDGKLIAGDGVRIHVQPPLEGCGYSYIVIYVAKDEWDPKSKEPQPLAHGPYEANKPFSIPQGTDLNKVRPIAIAELKSWEIWDQNFHQPIEGKGGIIKGNAATAGDKNT